MLGKHHDVNVVLPVYGTVQQAGIAFRLTEKAEGVVNAR